MSDPSNFVRNPPSVIVKVRNTSQESMNGQLGVVIQYNEDRGRYLVHMAQTQQTIALKPENLVQGSIIDQVKAQYLLLSKDPRVRQEIQKYYSLVQSTLPASIKPEYAAVGLGLLLLLGMFVIGFTRVLMMITLLVFLGLIVGPDVFGGGRVTFNWRIIAAKFPSRCRVVLEQTIPIARGKVSDNMAAGIIVVLLLFSARAIFLPGASRDLQSSTPAIGAKATVSVHAAYKLGFDDARLGKDFGSSLPESAAALSSSSIYDDNLRPIDYRGADFASYSPPKPWYHKLGMWQIMSIFNIARTLFEIGRDPVSGSFSAQLAMANLQQAPPMKLGLLGFSVYGILKVFF
jgi:hypothetical protein